MTASDEKRYWGLRPGHWAALSGVVGVLALIAAIVPIAQNAWPGPTPSSTATTPPPRSLDPPPEPRVSQAVSKASYLARAEKLCADRAKGSGAALPNRGRDPVAFGRWLHDITATNQAVLDALVAVVRPPADEDLLTDLFAQRQRANDLFRRAADAYEASQPVTGEQFLDTAIGTESAYRSDARAYGFRICIGSDNPGR